MQFTSITCERYQLAKIDTSVLVVNGSAVDLLRTVSYLPRRHHRWAANVCWSCQTHHWTLFSQSEATTFNWRNIDDWHCNCPGQRSVVISHIDYCNAVLTRVYGVHMRQLQRVLNAAACLIVRKRMFDRYVTSCIGCQFNTGIPLSARRRTRLPVDQF